MSPTERFLTALRDLGCEPKRSGKGWTCQCPAHDDRNPSLSIGTGNDGRVLVKCHAGCATSEVVSALGLAERDLFPDDPSRRNGEAPELPEPVPVRNAPRGKVKNSGFGDGDGKGNPKRTFTSAREAVAELERRQGQARAANWTYHDAQGEPKLLVVRFDTVPKTDSPERKPGKTFRPVARVEDGWIIGDPRGPIPLYNLPELLAAPPERPVIVCEGEKAADSATKCRLLATTSAHGAKAAAKTDWTSVRGRDVWVLPDNDKAGERYAEDVVRLTFAAGARSVRIIRLDDHWSNLPIGGDMADALDLESGDADTVRATVEALATVAEPEEHDTPEVDRVPVFDPARLFPPGCELARDFLSDLSRSTQTPPEMAAALGLAVVSGCVANVAEVRGHGDHVEPAQLWVLVLSDPGTRKSAVLAELYRPIFVWEREQAEEMRPAIAEATQNRRIDEKRLRHLEAQAAREPSGEKRDEIAQVAIELAQQIEAEPLPVPPALVMCEPTPEALAHQMAANHGRALLASAEADTIDIVQGRYSGSRNYGVLLKGHSGDAVRVHRIGRGPDIMDKPALAVALIVQPAAVEAFYADAQAKGRGLLARFAVVAAPNLLGSREVRPDPIRPQVREAWDAAIRGLLRLAPSEEPPIVRLSPESDALFYDFQCRVEGELGWGDLSDRCEWGGKLCGLALRVALTLHAMSQWTHGGNPSDSDRIDIETMRCAIAWADYFAESERHAQRRIKETPEDREQTKLVAWIEQRGGSVTVRDLTHGLRRFRGDPDCAERALEGLFSDGYGRWRFDKPGPKGGRPAKRLELVDSVTVTETPPEPPADAGNGDGDTPDDLETDGDSTDDWGEV